MLCIYEKTCIEELIGYNGDANLVFHFEHGITSDQHFFKFGEN